MSSQTRVAPTVVPFGLKIDMVALHFLRLLGLQELEALHRCLQSKYRRLDLLCHIRRCAKKEDKLLSIAP